jgi:signal transduction histidine kinase
MAGWKRGSRPEAGPAALVLLGMALFVTAVYVAVVRVGGALIGHTESPHLGLAVLATAIVALGFEPVRRRLRPVAVRLARGERAAPYEVLTRFLTEVTGAYATDEVPARMAKLLAEATGARYAQVWLWLNGRLVPAAAWPPGAAPGAPPPDPAGEAADPPGRRAHPVRHGAEPLGILVLQEHDRQPLTPVEEKLFAGLAAQAGLVLRSVRLRAELADRLRDTSLRADQLRASRERIVAAQDEERRRLERDIHDGAQQHVVALAVHLRLAQMLVVKSSARAPTVLAELRAVAGGAIGTLSDLSRGIYPRLLSDAGLGAALEAAAGSGSLPVELTVEEMDRPAPEVEAALYFCCLEALQNAAKHSGASRTVARVSRVAQGVELVVSDDGDGFWPASVSSGSGLANMRDRAESVGGVLRVDSRPGRGTVISIRVPSASVAAGVR